MQNNDYDGTSSPRHSDGRRASFLTRWWSCLLPIIALAFGALPGLRAEIIPPGCTGNGYGISLFVDKPTAHIGDTLNYSLLVGNLQFPACRAEQITASIVTPDGVTHQIELRRTILDPGQSDIYENVVSYVIRAQDIGPRGNVRAQARSTAVINQNISNEISENFRDVNTLVVQPCLSIEATCQNGVGENSPLSFSGVVRNCGDIDLIGVTVTNSVTGQLVFGPQTLAVGAQATFSGTYPPADGCSGTAVLNAHGESSLYWDNQKRYVSDSASVSCSNATTPGIEIIRYCPPNAPTAGTPLNYTGLVRNTGNVTLNNVVVTSDRPQGGTVVATIETLAPGAEASFSGSFPTPADACSISDTTSVTAVGRCTGQQVSDSVQTTCPLVASGSIDLTVQCPATSPTPGGTVVYSGVVRNPGQVTLNNVVVYRDGAPGTPVLEVATLAPGASAPFTASVTVPADVCSVSAGFTATASDRCGGSGIQDTAAATCPVVTAPAIVVTHQCPAEPLVPGQTTSFGGTVRNSGNVTLNEVRVFNGEALVFGPASLAPGASAPFTASVVAPSDVCSVTTTVSASGVDKCSGATVDSLSSQNCPVRTNPAFELTKLCPSTPPMPGGEMTYLGSLQNTGDVTLTGLTVTQGGVAIFGPVTLAPGASTQFQHSVIAPLNACSVTDTWVATGQNQCTGNTLTRDRTTTCPVMTDASLDLTLSCPAGSLVPGGTAVYTGAVLNTGDAVLTNVVVINVSSQQAVHTVAALAPGASSSFTVSVSVPQNVCEQSLSLSASAADQCGGRGVTDQASVTCPVASNPSIAVSHSCPTSPILPGQSITFPGTVRNTGDVTLTGVRVLQGETVLYGPATLTPGQTASFQGTIVAPADTCSVTTVLSASGIANCTEQQVTSSSTQTCPVTTAPAFTLTKLCPEQPAMAGGQVVFRGSVANTGNVTLQGLVVNSANGAVYGPIDLAPGQTQSFTVTTTAPMGVCSFTDTWNASAVGKCGGEPVTRTASTTCPLGNQPLVSLSVNCPAGPLTPGQSATYSGTVANTGSITLTNIVVYRSGSSSEAPVYSLDSLAPGASATFTATVPVPSNICNLTTSLSVMAHDLCQTQSASDEASTTCPVASNPAIAVAQQCPPASPPGSAVGFSGQVTNTGDITLTNVVVLHTLVGNTPVYGPATLEPGQSATFSGTYVIPESGSACTYPSVVTATGNGRCDGRTVQAQQANDCPIAYVGGVEVSMVCPPNAVPQGGVVTYTATVRNVGNVQLRNVVVTSRQFTGHPVGNFPTLNPGQEVTFNYGFTVPHNCCDVTDTLTVTAVDPCSEQTFSDTWTKTCPVQFNPSLAVTKVCPPETLRTGDTLHYTGTVQNTGNITLVDVYVRNMVKNQGLEILGPITLAPGQIVNYKHSYVIPSGFCGQDEVVATGNSLCGRVEGVTASVKTMCPVNTMPAIAIVKQCPPAPVANGGLFTFTATVINTGSSTLNNVVVFNNQPAPGTQVFGPVTLDAGASTNFTASYTLAADCCQTVDVLEARGQDACTGQMVSNTGAAACQVRYTPAISVTKSCSGQSYSGFVENVGNITLRDVTVVGGTATLLGPIELAPGEVKHFSGTASTDVVVTAQGTSLCHGTIVQDTAQCVTNPGPTLAIHTLTYDQGYWVVRWAAEPGATYRIERKGALSDDVWEALPGDVSASGPEAEKWEPAEANEGGFYRVRLLTK